MKITTYTFTRQTLKPLPGDTFLYILKRLLCTAVGESQSFFENHETTILLTLQLNDDLFRIEITTYVLEFATSLNLLFGFLNANDTTTFEKRATNTERVISRIRAAVRLGELMPYNVKLSSGVLTLDPLPSAIDTPFSTSDVLIGIAAAACGNLLSVNHTDKSGFRDKLLLEYLERAKTGMPMSLSQFCSKDDNPEEWYLAEPLQ